MESRYWLDAVRQPVTYGIGAFPVGVLDSVVQTDALR